MLKYKDKLSIPLEKGKNIIEILTENKISYKDFIAIKINEELKDLPYVVEDENIDIYLIDKNEKEALDILRHSAAHILAQAVLRLYPDTKYTIGPAIEDGFYYDFDRDTPFTDKELKDIEKEMKKIAKEKLEVKRQELSKEEAIKLFKDLNQDYKVELLQEMQEDTVSIYKQGEFIDLCRGPHVPNTSYVRAFKLLKTSGAYWRGDENNKMLWRIYGTAFFEKEQLKEYLKLLEEAKKRDHRKIASDLELYSIFPDEAGAGLVFWHPKGAAIRMIIEDFLKKEQLKAGYQFLYTPHIAKMKLWDISGHTNFYLENMYSPIDIDGVKYLIKPMNCPGHILVYKSRIRTYKQLPLRWAEFGTVYRYERSGVLHGLLRVRGFTQDDAHIFVRDDQLEDEILKLLDFVIFILNTFGFKDYEIFLSTQPEKFVGTQENWDKATSALKKALDTLNLKYEIDPGEGVFYGPKIDIKIIDSLKRKWQCSTIQVDFNLPERFNIYYTDKDNSRKRPIMIHRALLGSFERFFGTLIEHYAGFFPLWLAPVQMQIIPIKDNHLDYAKKVLNTLVKNNFRVELNDEMTHINNRIKKAQKQRIPYMLIIGDKEVQENGVSVRDVKEGDLGFMKLDEFINKALKEVKERKIK